jgi:transcriptional regulator with XRE-family HTH domain
MQGVGQPPRVTWQQKVSRLLDQRGWSAAYLERRLGLKRRRGGKKSDGRVLRTWLDGTRRPIGEESIIASLALALDVPEEWLRDGQDGEPPKRDPAFQIDPKLMNAVPQKYRRLVYAVLDDAKRDFLLAQLDVYERTLAPARAPS